MKRDKDLDERIITALQKKSEEVSASPQLKQRIDEKICMGQEEKYMRLFNKKKIAVSVAVACLLVSGVAFAGKTAGVISASSSMPEYESYEQMGQAQNKLGYSVDCVESFQNGYSFAGASIVYNEAQDENGNRLYTYKGLDIDYKKEGEPRLYLEIDNRIEKAVDDKGPDDTRICDGITIRYDVYTNKLVAADYVLTEKDWENEARDDYYISVGWDDEEIRQVYDVTWEKDGIYYKLSGFNINLSADELFDMVEEIIHAKN